MKSLPCRISQFILIPVAALMLGFALPHPVLAQSNYDIPRVTSRPDIDGALAEGEWADAITVAITVETEPGENIPAPVDTEALLMEDGETLYVAFIAQDPEPGQIRAFYRDRDRLWDDDWVGIVLDTFNDERRAYEFYVNPLGVQADDIWDDVNFREDEAWDAIWDSAGQITNFGYTVEMAIPLRQLRFSPSDGPQTWGIDLVRQYPRDRENRLSVVPRDRDIVCYLCQLAKADGFADLEPGVNLVVIPTLTTIANESRDPANGDWMGGDPEYEASLDVRWGISQDTYLNATINPDFSQVEADRIQLDINQTFSLFFPERRTFFLDGADYFDTFQNLVYTRNIAQPEIGAKLTGKTGPHTYGLLAADDEFTSFIVPRSLSSRVASLGQVSSEAVIGRYRYDIFDNSTIGGLVTHRQGDGYSNSVVSLDTTLRPNNQDAIYIQHMYSESEYPLQIQNQHGQAADLSDSSTVVEYQHNERNWDWRIGHYDWGKDFRADLGFINRVDYIYQVATLGRTWWGEGDDFFNRVRVALDYDRTEDQSGLLLEEEFEVFLNMNGPLQSSLFGLFGGSKTYWNGQYFDEQFNTLNISFLPTQNLELGLNMRFEDVVDFANTRLGSSTRLGPQVRYQFGRHLQLNLDHTWQEFDVDGGRLFTANLTSFRTTYQFNNNSFLRVILQYDDRDRNQDLYTFPVESRSRELTTQLLYSYRVNAATRFFVGYSDAGFQDDSQDSIYQTNRTFFAKFSYAWQP
ncbi:MAG: DUF5916 domain-containing protein [Gammaproteobacteria bacterium]